MYSDIRIYIGMEHKIDDNVQDWLSTVVNPTISMEFKDICFRNSGLVFFFEIFFWSYSRFSSLPAAAPPSKCLHPAVQQAESSTSVALEDKAHNVLCYIWGSVDWENWDQHKMTLQFPTPFGALNDMKLPIKVCASFSTALKGIWYP